MVGSRRWPRVVLAGLSLLIGRGIAPSASGAPVPTPAITTATDPAQDPAGAKDKDQVKDPATRGKTGTTPVKPDVTAVFSQPGDDPPRPFVPLHPRTVEDRQRIESVRLYSAARALEDRLAFQDAVTLLQQSLKLDPGSVAVARRLSEIYTRALGRPELAVQYGKQVLGAEPGDTETLSRLVNFFNRKNDTAACEALLKEVLANPKLEAKDPGRLLANFELGRLYSGRIPNPPKAAAAFAEVLAGLDDRSSNRLSLADVKRILGDEPAGTYLTFGMVFLSAGKQDLAIKAFERGLVYDEDNAQIPLLLADTLLKANRGKQALALVDRYVTRQPQGVEAYELMSKVLKDLKRENEITPRLEEAARRDSKNVPLQYVLADRYRETGQVDKAEALYKSLLNSQPTPQTYRALAASLLKRKKAGDLLKVICEAMTRPNGLEAVTPQLQAAAADETLAEAMLDAGFKELSAKPPGLPAKPAFNVLTFIAQPERGLDKAGRLERLLKLQNLQLSQTPSPQSMREVADTLSRLERFDEAARTLVKMLETYPNERNPRIYVALSKLERRAGRTAPALEAARKASELEPNDSETQVQLADLLGDSGKLDDAIKIYRKVIKAEPGNALYELMLGNMLIKFSRNGDAITLFQDMLKRYPNNDDVLKFAHSNLSIIYVNQGDYAKGEAELEALLQRTPDDAGINNDLGYLYADQGKNLEKAEAMIRKAVQEDPENHAYLDSLGWVLFKRGKIKDALTPLEKAVEIQKRRERRGDQPDATIREHLGDVYLHLQEIDKARITWQEAEKLASQMVPPDKRLPEIRKKLASLKAVGSAPKASTSRTP